MHFTLALGLLPLACAIAVPAGSSKPSSAVASSAVASSTLKTSASSSASSSAPSSSPTVPISVPSNAIPNKYIVKIQSTAKIDTILSLLKVSALQTYQIGDFKGFTVELSDDVVKVLQAAPGVVSIEQDAVIQPMMYIEHLEKKGSVTQSNAPWGLGRISHQKPGSTDYTYDSMAGAGTCAYVIDTGISTSHPDFEGRASFLANFAGDGVNDDGHGHGTHCAGTIGSKTYGVAKKTKLFAVKVLDTKGAGTTSGVIAGINFVANDAPKRSSDCRNGLIASLSLGGAYSAAVNSAAANAVKAGIFLSVAAGNSAQDAKNASPASEPTVFTVGATDINDKFASFSNFGSLVDILAPGVNVLSTWLNGGTVSGNHPLFSRIRTKKLMRSQNTLSGTSMATPHVAGLAAYLLSVHGKQSPAALSSRISNLALKSKISGAPSGTVNALAYNGNVK